MSTSVTLSISSADRTTWLKVNSAHIRLYLGRRGTFDGVLEDAGRGYRPLAGYSLVITRYEESAGTGALIGQVLPGGFLPGGSLTTTTDVIFAGKILTVRARQHSGGEMFYHITALDRGEALDRRRVMVPTTYENKTLKFIAEDLVTTFAGSEGLTTTNVDTGPTITEELRFRGETLSEAFQKLQTRTGYSSFVDADKDIHLSDFSANPAPFAITPSSDNWESVEIEETLKNYANAVLVTTDYDLGSGVNYVLRQDAAQQAARATIEGGTGRYDAAVDFRNLRTTAALNEMGDGKLRESSTTPQRIVVVTRENGLELGHQLDIEHTGHGINDTYLVEAISSKLLENDTFRHTVSCTNIEPVGRPGQKFVERLVHLTRIGDPPAVVVEEAPTGAANYVSEQTLTANPQVVTSPATPAELDRLTAVLTQDGTGGNAISWASDYDSDTPVEIDTRANAEMVFQFIAVGTKWKLVSPFRRV